MWRVIVVFLGVLTGPLMAGPISYQGQLQDASGSFDGQVELVFELHETETDGTALATDGPHAVEVVDGLFQVELDFGGGAFDGGERWLEVIVDGQALDPRQPITAAPMAVHAFNVPASSIEGHFWRRGGNAGTDPASDFLGTTDDAPFEIHVDGERALWIGPGATAPNLVAGHPMNRLVGDPSGATIAGGGWVTTDLPRFNEVAAGYGTIGGGFGNRVDGSTATIGGGADNRASGAASVVAGGSGNVADGSRAFVAGGWNNRAVGASSLAAGRRARAEDDGAFVWADSTNADFASTGEDQFLVRASGFVGINTNAPARDLHIRQVNDDGPRGIRIESQANNTWDIFNGTSTALNLHYNGNLRGWFDSATGAYNNSSDGRLKTDIEPLNGVLDDLLRLEPVRYRFRDQATDEATVGLIAQDVNPLFPELVSTLGDSDDPDAEYGLAYGQLAVLNTRALIELNQQQAAENQRLQAKMQRLGEKVEQLQESAETGKRLEERLARLEAALVAGHRVVSRD